MTDDSNRVRLIDRRLNFLTEQNMPHVSLKWVAFAIKISGI